MEHVAAAAIIDAHGIVQGWSEGARLLTGHPAEEVVGRPATALLDGEVPTDTVAARTGVVALRHRDGHRVELTLTTCPVLGPDSTSLGHVVIAHRPGGAEPTLAGQVFQQASMSMSVFDTSQRYLRLNDAACRLMGVPEETLVGRACLESLKDTEQNQGFLSHLRQVVETGRPVRYESFTGAPTLHRDHAWSIEMWPLRDSAGELTAVALAAFDSTDQYWARRRLALLNDAATAVGTTLDVVRTAEEVVELLVPRYADFASVDLLDWVLGADELPMIAGEDVLLRRVAHGSTTEGNPGAAVHLGDVNVCQPSSPPARALREGRAVLSQAGEPEFVQWLEERNALAPAGRAYRRGVHSMIAVPLRARGTTLGVAVCVRRAHPDDYVADDAVFAEELASRAAVCIDNARRFAKERTTALALQHSLLPQGLPGQAAVDVTHRYLPSGSLAGIGGDWFDVIPLSGSRVALVVGDVVGHGIQSSATMGRLRTAVRTLADVDLPPDELLTHLDDLVTHLAAGDGGAEAAELGATCLYAVYALGDNVLKAVLPEQPGDDVALLLARTRALGADRVATWDVPPDPARVATTRQAAIEQLAVWGLDEAAFVTELVVSELVTNAIRYGVPPIQLRLIRDRALICEVSDGSSTSPHLRRAHAFDEGGRGLLLVAQLTQRWGSRQTGSGKTIWAEQPLPER
ncbi:SpoIIE family protein phosphatase [Streptomyces sp. NPDC054833]